MKILKPAVVAILFLCVYSFAETCPKVNTTTQTPATMRAIVKSINCLVDAMSSTSASRSAPIRPRSADVRTAGAANESATQVDTLPIVGLQHSRVYPGFVGAILSVSGDTAQKSATVTWDSPQASLRSADAGECKLRLNPDRTVDATCRDTGGTVFVVYR